jgi:5-methylcytosine-specific restriction enzyme subunit McrC
MQLYEFGDYQTLPDHIELPAFKAYLKRIWENRLLFYEQQMLEESESEEESADIRKQGQAIITFDGKDIQARNYVGFIYYQGLVIELIPKIFQDTHFFSSTIFQHLLFYLSYVPGFRFPFAKQSLDAEAEGTPLQVSIHLFAVFTEQTLSRQAYVAYEEEEGPQQFMRGKLLTDPYMQRQLGTGQWQKLQTRYASLQYDNSFNRLVKYVVMQLLPLASKKSIHPLESVLFLLQEVSEQEFSLSDIDSIRLNRLYEDHQEIVSMCRFFLANEALCPPGQAGKYFSFLVPMERVFEYFVAGFIRQHFPQIPAHVQSRSYLATWQGEQVFLIRNDIWLPATNVILDTKYQQLSHNLELLRKDINQADLYQMLAYAIRRNSTQVHLLYPGRVTKLETLTYEIEEGLGDQTVYMHVHLIPVILPESADLNLTTVREYLEPLLKEALGKIVMV